MKSLFLLPLVVAVAAFAPAPAPVPPATGEHDWTVDPVHSSVVFRVKHAGAAWFKGTFDVINGSVTLDPREPEAGSVTLTIPVASIDTNDAKRDTHLKSGDFFSAAENPEITFTSTSIAKKGDALAVTGELAMAGGKKQITIPVEKTGEGEFHGKRVGYGTMFTVKRSDFGMTWGVADESLGDEVTLTIDVELVQAKK